MIISKLRNIVECNIATRKGLTKEGLVGFELSGKTVGIVGTGAIGLRVAELLKAFGCRLLGYSRSKSKAGEELGIEYVSLEELLKASDIVTLHTPLTEETRHLINGDNIKLMKETAILVNCARGPVVDIEALAKALKEKRIAGAAIDVFEIEPPLPTDHVLFDAKTALLTPHVAFATDESMVKTTAEKANEEMGTVTILINSQGMNKKMPVSEFPADIFNEVLNANVTSVMLTSKYFGAFMKEAGYGKIVNVTSVRGKIATRGPGNAAYCSSKGALDMLTKVLAAEFGPFGITVNAFGPNIMRTPGMEKVFKMRADEAGITVEEYLEQQGANLPLRRLSKPEDCVGTALFLASPASDFLTGNILYPDGGLTAIG